MVDATTLFGFAKSFESHLIVGNKTFNELGLHRFRVEYASKRAQKRRQKLAKVLTSDEVEQFQKNGFILKENFLNYKSWAYINIFYSHQNPLSYIQNQLV